VFFGLSTIALAALGVFYGRSQFALRCMAALAVAGLLFALGANTPLHRIAYVALPALEKARTPVRALCLESFAMAALAAWGAHFLLIRKASRRAALAAVAGTAALLLTLTALHIGGTGHAVNAAVAAAVLVLAIAGRWPRVLTGAALLAVILLETGAVTSLRMAPFAPGSSVCAADLLGHTELVARLKQEPARGRITVHRDELMTNLGDVYGLSQLQSFVAGAPANLLRLELHTPQTQALLGVTHHVGKSPATGSDVLLERFPGGIGLFRKADAMPPAWIVHRTIPVRDQPALRRAIAESAFRSAAPMAGPAPALGECSAPESVALSRRDTDTVLLEATLACRGMVVVADTYYPGWRAFVDGEPAAIYEVYGALRGVVAGPGSHRIELRYEPASVRAGAAITTAALLACFAALWRFARRKATPVSARV
jgi:hypothetical protein